jgi:hypothetical protein
MEWSRASSLSPSGGLLCLSPSEMQAINAPRGSPLRYSTSPDLTTSFRGRPCYVKVMAIPSYAYLKLNIPEPMGVITVESKTHRALDCE